MFLCHKTDTSNSHENNFNEATAGIISISKYQFLTYGEVSLQKNSRVLTLRRWSTQSETWQLELSWEPLSLHVFLLLHTRLASHQACYWTVPLNQVCQSRETCSTCNKVPPRTEQKIIGDTWFLWLSIKVTWKENQTMCWVDYGHDLRSETTAVQTVLLTDLLLDLSSSSSKYPVQFTAAQKLCVLKRFI